MTVPDRFLNPSYAASRRAGNMTYKGRYVYTIQPTDIGKRSLVLDGRFTAIEDFLGEVQVRDVGKQIWNQGGVYSVENDEQVAARMGGLPS